MKQKITKQIKAGFLPILDVITSKSKVEKWVFGVFFFIYACLGILFFLKYRFGFPDRELLNYDVYLWMYKRFFRIQSLLPFYGGSRHPLLMLIISPLIISTYIIKLLSGELVLNMLFVILVHNVIVALSITITYKYIVNLIRISKTHAIVLCVLFALFAHVLLLSFVPETFQFAMLGLLLVVYLTTDSLLNQKKIPLITNIILFVYVSGVTVSNGAKCVIAQLFQKDTFKNKRKSVLLSGLITSVLIFLSFFVSYIASLCYFGECRMKDNTLLCIFSGQANIISEMFFEPILFHHNYSLWGYPGNVIFTYDTIFPIIINVILYSIIICAVLVNIRKKHVLLLLSFFGTDVLIHIICGFGIDGPYIYCLHWLFIFPLLTGWLYKEISNKIIKTGLNTLLILLSIALAVNNIPRIIELIY